MRAAETETDRVTAMPMCRVTVMGMDQSMTYPMMRPRSRRPKMRHLTMHRPTMSRPMIHRATKVGSVDQSPVYWLPSGGKRLRARAPGLKPSRLFFRRSASRVASVETSFRFLF